MSKPYHIFTDYELSGKSPEELKKYLTGKVMTCAKCCAARVCLHAWKWEGHQYYTISCGGKYGGDACGHNIAGRTLSEVINSWNAEIDDEIAECGVEALDFATEIVII